jgi:hypothetical protein
MASSSTNSSNRQLSVEFTFRQDAIDKFHQVVDYLAKAGYPSIVDALVRKGVTPQPFRPHTTVGTISVNTDVVKDLQSSPPSHLAPAEMRFSGLDAFAPDQTSLIGVPVVYLRTTPSTQLLQLQDATLSYLQTSGADVLNAVSTDGSFHVSVCTKPPGSNDATPEDLQYVESVLKKYGLEPSMSLPIDQVCLTDLHSDLQIPVFTIETALSLQPDKQGINPIAHLL